MPVEARTICQALRRRLCARGGSLQGPPVVLPMSELEPPQIDQSSVASSHPCSRAEQRPLVEELLYLQSAFLHHRPPRQPVAANGVLTALKLRRSRTSNGAPLLLSPPKRPQHRCSALKCHRQQSLRAPPLMIMMLGRCRYASMTTWTSSPTANRRTAKTTTTRCYRAS